MIAYLPSPTVGVYHLGPIPIRMYALCIIAGIFACIWLARRQVAALGYDPDTIYDVAGWTVGLGIVGGRVYHVVTTPEPYFGSGGNPVDALKIWEGGLGIWGAVLFGALGLWIGCKRHHLPFLTFTDAIAPGLALAQAIGRLGNWFNNELYGAPTTQPWGLTIYRWDGAAGRAVVDAQGNPIVLGHFQPTFLYEIVWLLILTAFLLWINKRRDLATGQLTGLYLMGYPLGRGVIETLRTDRAEIILGQRLNVWTSLIVFTFGAWVYWYTGRHGTRGDDKRAQPPEAEAEADADSADQPGDEDASSTPKRGGAGAS